MKRMLLLPLAFFCAVPPAIAATRWSIIANDQVVDLDATRTRTGYRATPRAPLDLWHVPWNAIPCPGTGLLAAGSPLVDLVRRDGGNFDVTIYGVRLVPVGPEGPGVPPINACILEPQRYAGTFTDRAGAMAHDPAQVARFPADHDSFLVLQPLVTPCPIPEANKYTCSGGRYPWKPIIDAALLDTDEDGLYDEWEIGGLRSGGQVLDLHAMGADPDHKDLFVQMDATPYTAYEPDVLDQIAMDLAREPVSNPDGTLGIRIHIDAGPDSVMDRHGGRRTWGSLSRADDAADLPDHFSSFSAGPCAGDLDEHPFTELRNRRLERIRAKAFRYVAVVKYLGPTTNCYSGMNWQLWSPGFVIANWGPFGAFTKPQERGTFLHELGHSLGLRHGGGDDGNFKPNYQSVMNYAYQFTGVLRTGAGELATGEYLFSNATPAPTNAIDETRLDEGVGFKRVVPDGFLLKYQCRAESQTLFHAIAPMTPVDMDCDGDMPAGQRAIDITATNGSGPTVLATFNDLAHLRLPVPGAGGSGSGAGARIPTRETMTVLDLMRADAPVLGDTRPPTIAASVRQQGNKRVLTLVAHDDVGLASALVTVGGRQSTVRLSGLQRPVRDATRTVDVPAAGEVDVMVGDLVGNIAAAKVR